MSNRINHENTIERVIAWIEENLYRPLTIENVAYRSGYSRRHIQYLFKKKTGMSLGSYIRERRLVRAADALRCTSKKILHVALEHGFDSHQTFTSAFTQRFGKPPGKWREDYMSSQSAYRLILFLRKPKAPA
ncbi:helix-turn-helix domain-containing protein [Candidatus Pantoea deserta]|uniref:Helix-turn-helix domain-containing protein n=1 Tax=Candidatus Pantoea deserta TaxID=1869313 RepID=A0A3N4NMX4_9GAMM|nr:helix-turn-helix domain-containing protein [Pantoea deserta]RPD95908.1 helix-turn-helix domain-containing protein [Pantoea deserta]